MDSEGSLSNRQGKVIASVSYDYLAEISEYQSNKYVAGYIPLKSARGSIQPQKKVATGYVAPQVVETLVAETVTIPQNFAGLEAEMIPTRLSDQFFEIQEVIEGDDEVTVTATHIFYQNIKNFTTWKPDKDVKYSGADACGQVFRNAVTDMGFDIASDCKTKLKGKQLDYERKNIVEALLDPENGICKKFGLNLIRDNWSIYCLKEVGYDRGFVVENGNNLIGVERTESIEHTITRVIPIGKDKDGNVIYLDNNGNKYVDSTHIGDYDEPMAEVYDTGIKIFTDEEAKKAHDEGRDDEIVTAENIQERLLAAAQKRFTDDHIDVPEVSMTIEFISLGDTEEYVQFRNLDKVYLYDIISIKDTRRGYSYSAQVIGVVHDILTGMLLSVTIGSINNWNGVRKVATWQVPEVNGENIRLKSIDIGVLAPNSIAGENIRLGAVNWTHINTASAEELTVEQLTALTANIHTLIAGTISANDILAGSITADKIAANSITADKIAAGSITADKIAAGAITADKIAAGAITADKITAGAITTEKLAASSITTDKLAANSITANHIQAGAITTNTLAAYSVTAEKIAAGAIDADKISATSIDAINAKLGTANIANAEIQTADINFLHVKEMNAQSAFVGQAIIQEAVANKVFIPRLSVVYAQIVSATIGDLVIQATNERFYKLDVDMDGNVTATEVNVSSEEQAAGHTTEGRTIYLGTDIVAEDLNTTNIYASHALIDEITATQINVDTLFAREATIAKLNVVDIRNNTYFQAQVGTWNHGTTMAFEVDRLISRVADEKKIIYSSTEPAHAGLEVGDIWVDTSTSNTWGDLYDDTWDALQEDYTWLDVVGEYKFYTWDGTAFQLMYDSTVTVAMETEIKQTQEMIRLKASQSDLNTLSGDLTTMQGSLTVLSNRITSEVSRATNEELDIKSTIRQKEDDIKLSVKQGVTAAGKVSTVGSYIEIQYDEVKINSSGKVKILSGGYMNIQSGGKLKIESNGNMNVESGGIIKVESGGNLKVESGGNIKILAAGGTDAITLNSSGISMVTDGVFNLRSTNLLVKSSYGYMATQQSHDVVTTVPTEGGGTTTVTTTYYRGVRISDRYLVLYDQTSSNIDNLSDVNKDGAYAGLCIPTSNSSVAFWVNSSSGKATALFRVYGDGDTWAMGNHLTSSRAVKHNIKPLKYDSSIIDRLTPVSFIYNDDPEEAMRYGLIYEDTVVLMPVICAERDGAKGINYTELIPVLLKEIQGLRYRVSELEEERKAG